LDGLLIREWQYK